MSGSGSKRRRAPWLQIMMLAWALTLPACCIEKQESPPPPQRPANPDLTGEWQSDIQGADRLITKSMYRIDQQVDSVSLRLVSTKSPLGDELVPDGMWLEGQGAWKDNVLRLAMSLWVSGTDTCSFQVRGEMDREGRLLLHFPADLCGEKSLPYTRTLYRSPN